jgi:DNA-binding NarL/FixJ family response regulator
MLRALGGIEISDPSAEAPDVVIDAAHSPSEFVALLGADFEPHPRSLVLDLAGLIDSKVAALLGVLGYVRADCLPDHLRYGLREVAQGYPYAQEPFGGVFYHTRQNTLLTIEQKRILSLEAQGRTREQIEAALDIPSGTLSHRITELRKKLGVPPNEHLSLAAAKMGFGAPEATE